MIDNHQEYYGEYMINDSNISVIDNMDGHNFEYFCADLLRKVGFYDPIKNQTCLNVPAILYFLEKGAQPTRTVYDILRKAEFFKDKEITLS